MEAQVTGRIRATYLILGQEVQGGDVLVELDADAHRLRLEEERARLTALVSAPAMLRNEISAAEAAQREDQQAGRIAQDQARARYREAEAAAQLSRQEAAQVDRVSPAMLVLRTAGLLLTVPGTSRTLQGGRGAGR